MQASTATPRDTLREALSLPASDTGGWDALAASLPGAGEGVAGFVAALESRLLDHPPPPPSTRLRMLLCLARLGRDVDLDGEAPPRAADPLAWLDLALAADANPLSRARRLKLAAGDGTLTPRDLAPRLDVVASAATGGMGDWVTDLVAAFPEARRPSATAVLVAAFGVLPLD